MTSTTKAATRRFTLRAGWPCLVILGLCAGSMHRDAHAQSYPQRPIRVIVGFSAGGPADILARMVGQHLTDRWRQQVVVDNRPGAGGNITGETFARASNDGYTLYMVNIGHAVNSSLYRKLPFDPITDFAPIMLVATQLSLLIANLNLSAKSVSELIAQARSRPGTIHFATTGNGTDSHLSGKLFKMMASVEIVHVPYKGSPPALNDLLGGNVPLMIDGLPSAPPHVHAGRSRALGITTAQRSPAAPAIPTIAEQGVAGYESNGWNGLLALADTPTLVIERINREVAAMLELPVAKKRLAKTGYVPGGGSPDDFRRFIVSEKSKWSKVIERAGVRLD